VTDAIYALVALLILIAAVSFHRRFYRRYEAGARRRDGTLYRSTWGRRRGVHRRDP
jgi:hypothetical protein